MTDLDIGREYQAVAEAQGFDLEEMGRIAVEGIASTWLDASDQASLTREFEVVLQSI